MMLFLKYRFLKIDKMELDEKNRELRFTFSSIKAFKSFIIRYFPEDFKGVNVSIICTAGCQQSFSPCPEPAETKLSGDELLLCAYEARDGNSFGQVFWVDVWTGIKILLRQEKYKKKEIIHHLCSTCGMWHRGASTWHENARQEYMKERILALKEKLAKA